jgi:uncharacterized protein (DUF2336 family)
MTAVVAFELEELVKLARDKSRESRSILVAAINDLYSGEEVLLTERDRAIMVDIIRRLIHQVEVSVRRSLAERLAERPDAPEDLVLTLANDEIEVAHPILVNSEVLKDPELIEIVQHRTMEHQVAIAMRPKVSEHVSDALVETDNEQVITTLLSNQGAMISNSTMGHLVEESAQVPGYQEPLVRRHDLSPELGRKLYWAVSAALRQDILEKFDLDPGDIDEAMEAAVNHAMAKETNFAHQQSAPRELAEQVCSEDEHVLIELLRKGEVAMFLDKFTNLSKLRLMLVRRILFEPGGEGLAIACRGIGLDKSTFVSIFVWFRQGRLGDKEVEMNELARALSFYDQTNPTAARALMRRWQRDPEYLNALRQVERVGKLGS